MRINDSSGPVENFDTRVAKQTFIDTIQALNLGVLVCYQLRPVETAFADGPAKPGCILEVFRKM